MYYATALTNMGRVKQQVGDIEGSRRYFHQALDTYSTAPDEGIGEEYYVKLRLIELDCASEDWESARSNLQEIVRADLLPHYRPLYDGISEQIRNKRK